MNTTSKVVGLLFASALALATAESAAQSYPAKTIRFVDGYTPGGGTGVLGQIVAQQLSERLGQSVIVESRPGADSINAAEYVTKSAPDGYTLMIGATGTMVYNPGLYSRIPYDPVKDFAPITLFASTSLVFAVHPSVKASSVNELIAVAKARPGAMFYATGAAPFHVAAELFKKQAGVNIIHVPYKGSQPSITDTVAGEVSLVVVTIAPALSNLRAGKLRALATTGAKRSAILTDVPTMIESGFDFESGSWVGLFAPAKTPDAIINKLYSELSIVLKTESVLNRFAQLSYETTGTGMPPAEFGAMHRADLAKWTKVIKDLDIHAN